MQRVQKPGGVPANSMQNFTSLRGHTSGNLAVSGLAQKTAAASNMIML